MDFLTERKNWMESAIVVSKVQNTPLKGGISTLTVVVLYLMLEKDIGKKSAKELIKEAIKGFEIIPLTPEIIQEAFNHKLDDFEDAVQFITAKVANCEAIITRDNDFQVVSDEIRIYRPEEYLDEYGRGC